ncbi:MAG: STAS-like domain-containing protein [Deltaproteobacteria bacterium]|nr:STAS-like domain-containing protein [Deltaproteobacteria bacterium]MBW2142671.1 STAS-like domain-containing protein [Deltaproteobacteria bacterium]
MMKISVQDTCGKNTVTRGDGEQVKRLVLEAWKKESKIIIDFSNILVASVSFFDEAFGKLVFEHTKEKMQEKLSFENIEEYDRALLNDILISRYHQKELGQNGPSRS